MKKILLVVLLLSSHLFAHAPFIEGYWESWDLISCPEEIAEMPVDVIDIGFGHVVNRQKHRYKIVSLFAPNAKIKRLVDTAHNLGKEVKISLLEGCFPSACPSHDAIAESATPHRLNDPEQMAQAVALYVKKFNLDGVDFYIQEYPAGAQFQITMIEYLRQYLGASAKISYTAKAISAIPSPCDEIIKRAHPLLSSITIPAYNLGYGYHLQGAVERLLAMGIPSNKIVIGLMPGEDESGVWTSLEEVEKVADYVKSHDLGGVTIWSLSRDHANLTLLGHDAVVTSLSEIFAHDFFIQPIED